MKEQFSLRTVRKKIVMASKIVGIFLIVSYMISARLPFREDISFLIWLVFVVLLTFLVDYLLERFISAPISDICEVARRIAQLDFTSRCQVTSTDEFGHLAGNINKMSENLQQVLGKLETANRQLEKDVRQEKQLLEERKELIDRLSHEMKTPLGIIRAYAEGIQDETDEGKRQKYSEIILSETERMNDLIITLLDLSALENGAVSLEPERFDFVEFLETAAGRLLLDVGEIDFELQYELPEHKVYVYTDRLRMEQVLNNLILNAQKNVSPKGILKLSLVERGNELYFSIYNQGIPIETDKLPKVWEKFYRDKNAKYSGSGLGLAIVAQILSMQDLEYGVRNLPNGVEFFFFIPIIN
ncbi:MAG: HAMP domain-containing histidine kinase [Lachnospiraceae bacterium]|jgi:signal transduction histidine kinase|nr:HAMP domain-containing histidine kinase [Lachnospiraceae bacterium]